MCSRPNAHEGLFHLIDAALSGSATLQQTEELESILKNDRKACEVYSECASIEAELHLLVRGRKVSQTVSERIAAATYAGETLVSCHAEIPCDSSPPSDRPRIPTFGVLNRTWGYVVSGWPMAYMVATVIVGLGITVAAITQVSRPTQVVQPSPANQSPISTVPSVVGRITGMVDCQWSRADDPTNLQTEARNLKSPVSLGDNLILRSGLLEITYDTGAKVTLQGPCTYQVSSATGGHLSIGKLRARVGKKTVRSEGVETANTQPELTTPLSPSATALFFVTTPTATITDLGTEFGVEVKSNEATMVCVIRGVVEASRTSSSGAAPVRERLVAGEGICFDSKKAPPRRVAGSSLRMVLAPELKDTLRHLQTARGWPLLTEPIGIIATAYHRVFDTTGRLWGENDRHLAFRVATDGVFGRGLNNEPPLSSFDTYAESQGSPQTPQIHQTQINEPLPPYAKSDFVGLRYGRLSRFDRIKVFLGRQMGDGGNWSEMPRLFILKKPVDTDRTPPEQDPVHWTEIPLHSFVGSFSPSPNANPGMVLEIPLTGVSAAQRTGYGWAVGGVQGNGTSHYISITELRAYGETLGN